MAERYWLVLPNGGRQMIDPTQFDMASVAEHARGWARVSSRNA